MKNVNMFVKMYFLFSFVITFVSWSEQHLVFPINYCNVAMACLHDTKPVCAITPDGCTKRSFLDQCDMFEYNCDFGAHYEMNDCVDKDNNGEITEATCNPTNSKMYTDKESYFYSIYKEKPIGLIIREDPETAASVDLLKIPHTSKMFGEIESCPRCDRPHSWATTVYGETRDFFRVLQDY